MEEGANLMHMIGCDFYPRLQQLAVLDKEAGRRQELRLSHSGVRRRCGSSTPGCPGRGGWVWRPAVTAAVRGADGRTGYRTVGRGSSAHPQGGATPAE
jgi:hypothetical protein